MPETKKLTKKMGGKIKTIIEQLEGYSTKCNSPSTRQGTTFTIQPNNWKGYRHEGGVKDKRGDRYWLYYECPHCHYQWSWHKLMSKIKKEKERKK